MSGTYGWHCCGWRGIADCAGGICNRAISTAMYRGGLRVNEALALWLSDVDPPTARCACCTARATRTRAVSVDDGAIAVIQRWMDWRREFGFRNGPLF